ncbi:MAG TPA: SRPBCC domain-containing protein [Acidimicrobiales bacterium]|jgi:DNA-binding transcriptional ArsR family regulator|nr:SRPBCC domain-containing protein [Acidimicrobiales bacterium]
MATGGDEMDASFRALADGSRRRLLDSLNVQNGQTLRELCQGLDMARQSVSKHLAILESANLITTIWRGREKLHYLNPVPINEIAERWINHYDQTRLHALSDLKKALEESLMDKPSFVYTTYIKTTPEGLWRALTEPAFTERYWGLSFSSDWKEGSVMTLHQNGVTVADPAQVVLESDPFRRLAYTWHTFTKEWADSHGMSAEFLADISKEPRSRISFDLEEVEGMVKLTVVHDGFEAGSNVLNSISYGWPMVLASLKTFLETGEPLNAGPT